MIFKIENPIPFWYKLAKGLALVGIGFWLLETVYFLIMEGWHISATSEAERWADDVFHTLLSGSLMAFLFCLIELVDEKVKTDARLEKIFRLMEDEDADKTLKGLRDEDLEPLPQSETRNRKSAIE